MEGFQFIDIIILAMVAGFIVLRLRSVLGRRTGHEPTRDPRPEEGYARGTANSPDNVVTIPGAAQRRTRENALLGRTNCARGGQVTCFQGPYKEPLQVLVRM